MFLLIFILWNASGTSLGANAIPSSENSPSDFAKIVQSKQTKQARVCGADHQLLRSLANTREEVILTIPNEQLEHIAEFPEEAEFWVVTNVVPFLPATKIRHILAGNDVVTSSPGNAYFLVPAMLNLHSALVAARLDGRVKVSSALSEVPLAPAWSTVTGHLLRFLKETGSPLFLKSHPSEATDTKVDGVYGAMRALNFSGIPVIAAGSEELGAGEALVYHSYLYDRPGEGRRRSLATGTGTGTFCLALQNADPTALQAGLNWACGQGHADCSAIQPGGPCYKQNNLPALASYAYNDYYHKMASTGATCSFNGTATTTASDPSSGSCVFAGSTMAGGSNSSVPSASPPAGLAPPAGFTPPVGSSPPTDFSPPGAGTPPPTGFTPPAGGFGPPSGFGSPPTSFGPPGSFNGSGTFGGSPSSTLNPFNGGCRHVVSRSRLSALSAIVLAVVLASTGLM